MNSVDELKLRLIEVFNEEFEVWKGLQQNVIDAAIKHQRVEKATESMRACRWTTF